MGHAVSRRTLLRGAGFGAAGIAAAALIGCGSDDDEEAPPASGGGGSEATATSTASGEATSSDSLLPFPRQFPEPDKQPKTGGTMVIGVSWDVGPMDPTKSGAGGTITVPNSTYNRLIGYVSGQHFNPDKLELKPELAEAWESTPDGLTYTFHIQPGIKWQNIAPLSGREFVATDAKFAFERYASEGVHQSLWSAASAIEAPDDSTLVVTLSIPDVDFIWPLGGRYQTIFPHELVDDASIEKVAIGTGPMILKEALASQRVTLEANPDYFMQAPYLAGVEYRVMPDFTSRLAAFRTNQIDYGYALAGKFSDVAEIQKTNPDVQLMSSGGTSGGYGFGMNTQHPKFQDERVRQALALAMDHETTVQIMFEGYGVALPDIPWAFVFDEMPSAEKGELGPYFGYNPDEAKALLTAAGAADLQINAAYYTYASYDVQRAEVLTSQLREVGVTLNAVKSDYTEFNSKWTTGGLEEATTSGWGAAGFDANNYFYNQVYTGAGGNRWSISDPQIDELSEKQRIELDPAARREILRQIWDIVNTKMYRIPQAGGYAYETMQPWLRGFRSGGPLGSSSYYYDWGEQLHEMWLDK